MPERPVFRLSPLALKKIVSRIVFGPEIFPAQVRRLLSFVQKLDSFHMAVNQPCSMLAILERAQFQDFCSYWFLLRLQTLNRLFVFLDDSFSSRTTGMLASPTREAQISERSCDEQPNDYCQIGNVQVHT